MAVALSQLHDPPLRGYVAYRSIVDYINEHGLALMEGEAAPLPTPDAVSRLIYDTDRLEKLLHAATTVPINYDLAPVPIVGSEKGEAAFYYWAFRLFGMHVISLWYFYFVLLAASVIAFWLTFWRQPFCMLLLMLYLIGHLYSVISIASLPFFQTVHNSRFFPVLAMLPALHLLLLGLTSAPPRLSTIALGICQTALLFFLIFSRLQTAWQPLAVFTATVMALPFRRPKPQHWNAVSVSVSAARGLAKAWPAALLALGGLVLISYQHIALDRMAYSVETKSHTFWDPLLVGTVSANPELLTLYGMGQPPFSDTMGYYIARKFLIDHNDTSSQIALVRDGVVVGSFAMHNMGAYDRILRRVFFDIFRQHPWLIIWSFAHDKPLAELQLLSGSSVWDARALLWCILLAVIAGVLTCFCNPPKFVKEQIIVAGRSSCIIGLLSLSTIFISPSIYIPDTILYFLLLMMTFAACMPLLVRAILEQRRIAFGSTMPT